MNSELMGPLVLCGVLISITLPVMLRLLRATDGHRQQKEMDKLIEQERRRMRARFGR